LRFLNQLGLDYDRICFGLVVGWVWIQASEEVVFWKLEELKDKNKV